jgi:hypothetical protein
MNEPSYEKEFTFTSDMSAGEGEEKARTIPVETPERAVQNNWASQPGGMRSLLDGGDAERLRARWNEIQAKFVDEPRASVSEADELVSEAIQHMLQKFNDEISSLEHQWKQGDEISTEDLRQVLQRYRSFFNNLVV